MAEPLNSDDPAHWMLTKGRNEEWAVATGQLAPEDAKWVTKTHSEIYRSNCYICTDPEFALMGLPVCKPCPVLIDGSPCGVHWAADDSECDKGCDVMGYYMDKKEES